MVHNPCYNEKTHTDCDKRQQGCAIGCNAWKVYESIRNQGYLDKKKQKEIAQGLYDNKLRLYYRHIKKNKKRKLSRGDDDI